MVSTKNMHASGIKHCDCLIVEHLAAAGDDIASECSGAARPVCDHATCTTHNRNERLNVIRLQTTLNGDIQKSHREHAEDVAVTSISGETGSPLERIEVQAIGWTLDEVRVGDTKRGFWK